ncbi:thiamine-phosphate synthase [Campylobacterota bacterium]|nr:thiamine-phosphate synthase [Campylobacterota bacterium]
MTKLRGLYAISDELLTPDDRLLDMAQCALKGGATIFQLRHKSKADDELLQAAFALKELCNFHNALFIINDRIELAKQCNADGVHIGKDDRSLQAAREFLGAKALIGVSCYGDQTVAEQMQKNGADYVAFGSFFASKTKPNAKVISCDLLTRARETITLPICAIGGITIQTAPDLIAQGADMIAVIGDLWSAEEITAQAKRYGRLF